MGTIMSTVSSILICCVKNRDLCFNRAAVFSFSLAEIVKPLRVKREKTISQIVCFIIFFLGNKMWSLDQYRIMSLFYFSSTNSLRKSGVMLIMSIDSAIVKT